MLKARYLLFVIIILIYETISAQSDSLQQSNIFQKAVVPASLIALGLSLNGHSSQARLRNNIASKKWGATNLDDYLSFVPMSMMYTADIFGGKSKNGIATHSANLFLSEVTMVILNKSFEYGVNNLGPDGQEHSFPSGHTAHAFVGATVLYHEYKDNQPWLAYSGFVIATSVGVLRITNDKHWYPDVLMGAGIGILSANLIYWIQPFKNTRFLKRMDQRIHFGVNENGINLKYAY